MITVNFSNGQGVARIIGRAKTVEDATSIINDFLKAHNYVSYYQRWWQADGKTYIDVGSHSEFFWLDKEVL